MSYTFLNKMPKGIEPKTSFELDLDGNQPQQLISDALKQRGISAGCVYPSFGRKTVPPPYADSDPDVVKVWVYPTGA